MDKQKLAQKMRAKRLEYSIIQRAPWDKMIHDKAMAISEVHKIIGIYAAYKGEVDTYGIIETLLWDKTKIIVMPRIENNTMVFYRIRSLEDLKPGHFGILEPQGNEVYQPDLMLVPLSVFNAQCHRIGYGKGYYDRYFEDHPCYKVGLAYDFQKSDARFEDGNDIACDLIITEKEYYYVA